MGEWEIGYDDDVGPGDKGFLEWWTVSNGEKTFKCESEEDAEWLQGVLSGKLLPSQL